MAKDKFTAVWVSHTSISDFLVCPRAYYLKNKYKDPNTGNKIKIMSPALALGQAVHEVLESLSVLPTNERFRIPLIQRFEDAWKKVTGKNGGFFSEHTERQYKERGEAMIRRAYNHPGPLERLAVKIQKDLPYFWLSEEDNIILCGKVDWLEYIPENDSVHIIDFKTGKSKEDPDSLQLPIYHLLVDRCQKRRVSRASYWYLAENDTLTDKKLPDLAEAETKVLAIAREIKLARQLERFPCPTQGCRACEPFEMILNGGGEFVGNDEYNYDVYVIPPKDEESEDSIIL